MLFTLENWLRGIFGRPPLPRYTITEWTPSHGGGYTLYDNKRRLCLRLYPTSRQWDWSDYSPEPEFRFSSEEQARLRLKDVLAAEQKRLEEPYARRRIDLE